jgi:hypothetical protein
MLTAEALDTQRDLLALGVDSDNHKRNSMLKDLAQGIIPTQVWVEESTMRRQHDDDKLQRILKNIGEACRSGEGRSKTSRGC